jgi:glycosyltransferase involved in cell wall biosynthesis
MHEALSALVCTRNRPHQLAEAVRSLLQDPSESLELIVIDQSDDAESERALAPYLADRRLRYVRTTSRGKGRALNEGLALARGSILVCTDDDCLAPPRWVSSMTRALASRPGAVVAFCQVLPVEYDRNEGYVPAYELAQDRLLRSVRDIRGRLGLGAGMAVRRDFVRGAGGFDEAFGPGGTFPSADDWEIAIRALLLGHSVFEVSEIAILHDGFRTHAEGRAHTNRDWVAIGAVSAKPLRAGHASAVVIPVGIFFRSAVWPVVRDMLMLRRPRGMRRISAFARGFIRGLATPVDKSTLHFKVQ